MFPRFDPDGRLFAPIIPSILENGMHVGRHGRDQAGRCGICREIRASRFNP